MNAQKYSLNLIGFVDSPYAHMPAATVYSRAGQEGLSRYRKSITEGRRQDLQRQAMTLMSNPGVDVKEQARHRRDAVLQRVTREFWTNLVTRGEDTAMLRHLQAISPAMAPSVMPKFRPIPAMIGISRLRIRNAFRPRRVMISFSR